MPKLKKCEIELFFLLSKGLSTEDIAQKLNIKSETVKNYTFKLLKKITIVDSKFDKNRYKVLTQQLEIGDKISELLTLGFACPWEIAKEFTNFYVPTEVIRYWIKELGFGCHYPETAFLNGQERDVSELATEHGLRPVTLRYRLRLHWSLVRSLHTPVLR